ncbi:hypothetical protein LVJ59_17530 [Microbacterium sp. KKR3/1]|uniref:VG15 protein n=1 Tax=Microbacterium sp. KKR3/1 TaxID=2904241 RepID=UPI001E5E44D0|nr:hypothetical protein [Microbacterium sp. KKR3/1]MCE0510853.1 hypothetical protein [Microbacterium sp. KKR3/1]
MATQAQIQQYRLASQTLVTLGQSQIRDVLSAFGPSSNPVLVRDALIRYFPDFMTAFGDTAAVLGADFYDMVRNLPPSAGTVQTVFAQPAKVKQSEGVVRWAIGSLFAGEWDSFESALLGASQRLILQPQRETIDLMAQADARSGRVSAVAWSRQVHPERARTGKSCDFCIMLAGRGPVYRSQEAAGAVVGRGSDRTGFDADGNRLSGGIGGGITTRGLQERAASFHDECNCTTVPTFYEVQDRPGGRYPQVLVPIS